MQQAFRITEQHGRVVVIAGNRAGNPSVLAVCRHGVGVPQVREALADFPRGSLAALITRRGQVRERLRRAELLEPDLPSQLRFARETAGLTQGEAAKRLGVCRKSIVRWETGAMLPSVERLIELAGVYETTFILGEDTPAGRD
jgi:DNA-binding XRE family transcriptional regulator